MVFQNHSYFSGYKQLFEIIEMVIYMHFILLKKVRYMLMTSAVVIYTDESPAKLSTIFDDTDFCQSL